VHLCYNKGGDLMLFEKEHYQEKIDKIKKAIDGLEKIKTPKSEI
jgi:hypothetical protein